MKFNKYKAFTIAELMIILSLLTIIMAAFAPVFTVRYNNASTENVWTFVPNDDQYDAYYDQQNKSMTAQAFVGVTPSNKADIARYAPYAKLVIRPSELFQIQPQIQFRYGSENNGAGRMVGEILANNNGNLLFGGPYKSVDKHGAKYNTAYGIRALKSLNSGESNTALGYGALDVVTGGNFNTAIGYMAGYSMSSASRNTLIGYSTGYRIDKGYSNTIIGDSIGLGSSSEVYGNTILGQNTISASNLSYLHYNTVIGSNSMPNVKQGEYNTAVGAGTFGYLTAGAGNTAIGYKACDRVTGNYKTCIGTYAGSRVENSANIGIMEDSEDRVFIGSYDPFRNSFHVVYGGGASVLEVHNINSKNSGSRPVKNLGNTSVVINGNLIVRGQSYFTGNSPLYSGPSLMLFYINRGKKRTRGYGLTGLDGNRRRTAVIDDNNHVGKRRAQWGARYSCLCTLPANNDSMNGIPSYDWTTQQDISPHYSDDFRWGGSYEDKSTGNVVKLSGNGHGDRNIDLNYAHMYGDGSCCPDLRSDIRLKDLNSVYSAGLDELKELNTYNFTFKNDKDALPHVGVIAQDLKQVFPTAVSKDKNGYYRIRWDEMFYAAINAIKTINSKVEALAARISNDRARVSALKHDNALMEKKLDVLEQELLNLEKSRK